MKKNTSNKINKKEHSKNRIRPSKQKIAGAIKHMDEEDTEDIQPDTTTNWSQAQDRSEDLVNETDPFIQDPEKRLKIPKDNPL